MSRKSTSRKRSARSARRDRRQRPAPRAPADGSARPWPSWSTIIGRADLSNVLRRQSICASLRDETPKPLFREIYVSIPDLRDSLMPQARHRLGPLAVPVPDADTRPRVLALLRRNDDSGDRPFLQPQPQHLDAAVAGIPPVRPEPARRRARQHRHRAAEDRHLRRSRRLHLRPRFPQASAATALCLDGVSAVTLAYIDRDRLGLDLVKMFWSPDMADPLPHGAHRRLPRCDRARPAARASSWRAATARRRSASASRSGCACSRAAISTGC